jgi:hypothetical protein
MKSGAEAVGLPVEVVKNRWALGRQRHRFRQPVRKRSSWGEKWCRSGGVADESGVESEGFGVADARLSETGAEPERSAEKWCRTGPVLGETGAESERFGGKVVQNRSSLRGKWCGSGGVADESGAESEGFGTTEAKVWATGAEPVRFVGKVMQNRSSYGWKWCETGVVSDR